MTEPKTKSELLAEGTKTYLLEVFIAEYYNRKKEVESKFMTKGNEVEAHAIDLLSLHKEAFYIKNEDELKNTFIKGTPDIASPLIDIKSSWDIHTFFKAKHSKLNKDYYWQLQSYMALTGEKTSSLVYVLENTPAKLIMDEKYYLSRKMGIIDEETPEYIKKCQEIERNGIYNLASFIKRNPFFDFHSDIKSWSYDIPLSERIHETPIERNDADIARLYKRIEDCRNWMNENLFKLEAHASQIIEGIEIANQQLEVN